MSKLRWQLPAFLLGGVFFFLVLRNFGFASVASVLASAGEGSFLVFLLYPAMCLPDVLSWQFSFAGEYKKRLRFGRLYSIRLAGEAVNNITPFIDIGGEPLKIHLAHRAFAVPAAAATASTVVARTSLLVSEALFMVLGVVLSFSFVPMDAQYRTAFSAALVCICGVFIFVLYVQQKDWLKKYNADIPRYYAAHAGRFWTAVALNTLGWTLGGVETYLFCRVLGVGLTFTEAMTVEALLQLIRTASFFIPGNLGAQEGGLAFLMARLGVDPVLGVGLSLLKRFRQILWTAAGFLVWGYFQYEDAKTRHRTLKSGELLTLDTWLDRRIHRPVAEVLAALLAKTPVTPNQVTVCTVVPALLSGVFFSLGSFVPALLGVFFFYVWSVADHVDGSLARRKQLFSKYGQFLDDAFDNVASTLVFLGIFLGFVGLWNAEDRRMLSVFFYLALAVNVLSQMAATFVKRDARRRAVESRRVSEGFLWKQRLLDFLTARDGVYFLMTLVVCAHGLGPGQWVWYPFVMGLLIVSLYGVAAFSLAEFVKQR